MKKLIQVIVVVIVAAGVIAWLTLNLRAKAKYDQMTKELAVTCAVKPFDEHFSDFLADVKQTWSVQSDTAGGPYSDGLKLAGLSPSVANLTHLLTCPMPAWSWISPQQNRQSAVLGAVKSLLLMTTVDGAIHMSEDKSTAAIWCATNALYVFRNGTGGMEETLYFRKKTSTQASEVTAGKLAEPQR